MRDNPSLKPELSIDRFQSSLRNLCRSMSGDWRILAVGWIEPFVVPATMTKRKASCLP